MQSSLGSQCIDSHFFSQPSNWVNTDKSCGVLFFVETTFTGLAFNVGALLLEPTSSTFFNSVLTTSLGEEFGLIFSEEY